MDPKVIIHAALASFRFKYEGGGCFRDRTVPRGKKADVVHGDEVLEAFAEALEAEFDKLNNS